MAVLKVFLLVPCLLVLAITCCQIEGKHLKHKVQDDRSRNHTVVGEKKFAIGAFVGGARGLFDLVTGVASFVQGFVCTFQSEACSEDETLKKVTRMEAMLEKVEKDIVDIKDDVLDILEATKVQWYFDHIKMNKVDRRTILGYIKDNMTENARPKMRIDRFVDEVLGTNGKDEYVEKALYHIPNLITDDLVTRFMDKQINNRQKTPEEAGKLAWRFIRKLFRAQEDGYVSVILAGAFQFKGKVDAFKYLLSEVCTWWPRSEMSEQCAQLTKPANTINRRKMQQDFILSSSALRHLALVPAFQVEKDCNNFQNAEGLLYSKGFIYVAQPNAKNVLIVNQETMEIVKTLDFGDAKPFSVAIDQDKMLLAVATREGEEEPSQNVKMYKITGNLEEPKDISIEHYYDMERPMFSFPVHRNKEVDVKAIAFCGGRLAYADFNGAIRNFGIINDKPNVRDRADWYTQRRRNINVGNINYLSCSNTGREWLVHKTGLAISENDGVGAIPSYISNTLGVILDGADAVVKRSVWSDIRDGNSRMNFLKGMAMDSQRRFLYSSGQLNLGNSISGIYKRTCDGVRHFIREWAHEIYADRLQMFGMAVDDNGFMFSVQQEGSAQRCLVKYHHVRDFEDIPDENIAL